MSKLKNKFGENVSWFCLEASITLKEYQDKDNYTIDDEFEVYGEDSNGKEGSVSIGVFELFESAHAALDEKDGDISSLTEINRLQSEENKRLSEDNAKLREALQGLVAVVGESTGVCGYHLNGDIAEWDEFGEVAVALQLLESMK